MTHAVWVLGAGGLLGSQVARRLGTADWPGAVRFPPAGAQPPAPFPWRDREALDLRMAEETARFAEASRGARGWAVLWCAGAGVVGTRPEDLERESVTFERFLDALARALDASPGGATRPGMVALASSAGGVWAGSPDHPITETSPARPLSPYGHAKLRQEKALADWAASRGTVSTMVARISNLYGPGQRMDKPQGLISHMSRSLILRHPVHIYVPLDTIRDYVFVEDAARSIVRWTRALADGSATGAAPRHVLRICAAGEGTTIAGLIGSFRRIAKRRLKVVHGLHPVQNQQPRRLVFRPSAGESGWERTGLVAGIARVYRHQLALFEAGELPPPSRTRP